jgi:hypothetical protein
MKTPTTTTLLDLIQTVGQYTTRDDEVVATVSYLINSGKVRLCGTFAGATIDLAAPAYGAPTRPQYLNVVQKVAVSAAQ